MEKLFDIHPSEDQLDLYAVGHLSREHERLIEEHYLGCESCTERLCALSEFIAVLKAVLVDSPQLLRYQTSPPYNMSAPVRGPEPKAPILRTSIRRTSILRIAAMLLIGISTAVFCNDPSPLRNTLPKVAVANAGAEAFASPAQSKPSEIRRHRSYGRRLTLVRLSRPYRTFQPPPSPPPQVAAVVYEIQPDLVIPSDWISERESGLMALLLEPPSLPLFHSKPRWYRRVLLAVRRSFEPPRW
jgi:hypothetical protein